MAHFMLSSVFLVLFLSLVNSSPTTSVTKFVPPINDNGVVLVPSEKKYSLRIDLDGSTRDEIVEQIAPDLLQVKGTFFQRFPGSINLLVTYEAGPNGYVAKYSLSRQSYLTPAQQLQPIVLKTAAG
ncbi:uncharacterized protein LOC6546780 [Drosophila erecta]|uniref:Uncharacterized protein n=1 Tax=Drosophila erecta TaxID=7220 RepID=B3NML5_DROER|nr:uncharacterized protein LOC6546780 [Drosophila erecta]EDV54954.2 uncharacterized protein Dere_GG21809 [Drosophila erecta]